MDVTKLIIFLLIFIPAVSYGQKSVYPKDTVYIKFEHKKGSKNWNAKFERNYQGKLGIYFNVESKNGDMALFYPYTEKADTLCIKYIEDYNFSNLKEIEKRKVDWINNKFKSLKYKPYSGSKNGVFQSYLIEVISNNEIVEYPVLWRNEGATP